jgi:hypothetical protein
MTDPTDVPRLTKAQLRELIAARQKGQYPPCPVCEEPVDEQRLTLGAEYEEQRVVTNLPCGHRATYNVNVAAQAQSGADSGAATEATKPTHQDEETH